MDKDMVPQAQNSDLQPLYMTSKPDEPLHLFQGRFGFRQGDYYGEGEGTLDLVWRSRPRLQFNVPLLDPFGVVYGGDCILTIPSLNAETGARISKSHMACGENGQSLGIQGEVNRNMAVGGNASAVNIIFHVVNFWPYWNLRPENATPGYRSDRVFFQGGGWKVTLQAVPGLSQLHDCLYEDSGYGITHAGKAERVDGSLISPDDAADLFGALHSFLSFAKGSWSPPILYIGVAYDGSHVWQDWGIRHATPWKSVDTWFPEHEPECLARLFPGFMRVWSDPDRHDILESVIYWYVEAHVSWGIEGAIMLCQSGLERLAYYIMVHDKQLMAEKDFEPRGKSSAERLRLLLTQFNLPTEIGLPRRRIKHLPALAAARSWKDAPDALVQLRNSIVHPSKSNDQRRANYPIAAQIEALTIWMWYFEVVLLKWLGFSGNYVNRQTIEWNGETEVLP